MSLFHLDNTQVQNAYRALAIVWALSFAAAAGAASAATGEYKPVPGQKGKDVVWIPSPSDMVEKMLDMAKVTAQDFVIDLGSGDGRNVIAAAKRGARALGVEYNPDLVELSKRNAAQAGVSDKASFVQGDMYAADISKASVMILFLIPQNLWKLLPNFLAQLRPGTRIVSNTYEIGMGWDPDDTDRLKGCLTWCVAYLYIVPAKVDGTWRLGEGELTLEQNYQQFTGTYTTSGLSVPVTGVLRGSEIRFGINNVEYNGSVKGDTIEGIASGRTETKFSAKRAR
jgi:protein-L-isoaspartate O-methyltransferase